MTPAELRRIFDPKQRRKGFEAWKGEQAEAARLEARRLDGATTVARSWMGYTVPLADLLKASLPEFALASMTYEPSPPDPLMYGFGLMQGRGYGKTEQLRREAEAAAEREMLDAVGELVRLEAGRRTRRMVSVGSPAENVSAQGVLEVCLTTDATPSGVSAARPLRFQLDPALAPTAWCWDEQRFQWLAVVHVRPEWAVQRLHDTLGPEALAALQPKLEVRTADGRTEAVVARKTLRKDT